MKKIILVIAVALFSLGANAQQTGTREPVAFAKDKIANIAKYVEVSKDDSTKLQTIFVEYQKEALASINDREKLGAIVRGLSGKIEAVLGVEKYKTYKEKYEQDPANAKKHK
ncbi:MAG: hypothetical protein PHX13_12335 [Thiovulaceae bacterium]|nr:hypothetical protein [Sulfurimonadaceae bacterium]